MKRRNMAVAWPLLGCAATIGLSVACSHGARTDRERKGTLADELAVRGSQVVSAARVSADATTKLPVVISFTGAPSATGPGSAQAIFTLDCADATKASAFYHAFGLTSTDALLGKVYASSTDLTNLFPDAPQRFVSCTDTSSPVLQVFARVDADPTKGDSSYLVRFKGDPSNVYGLACAETLPIFNWTAPLSSAVPINTAVYKAWTTSGGIKEREINCKTANSTALPAVNTTLPQRQPLPMAGADAALYLVSGFKFDGIDSDAALYLISNGKGYPIACDSNPEDMIKAFGFPSLDAIVNDPKSSLTASDPVFLASNPGKQPTLRCNAPASTVFQASDESPLGSYFQLDPESPTLLRFECPGVAQFFDQTIVGPAPDGGAPNHVLVPQQSLSYLFVDPNVQDATTPILSVGCAGLTDAQIANLRAWFFKAYGRYPNDTAASPELAKNKAEYKILQAKFAKLSEPTQSAIIHSLLRQQWAIDIRANELAPVMSRAIAAAPHQPSAAPDASGATLTSYLLDKLANRKGTSLDSLYDTITTFVDTQSIALAAKMHDHFHSTFGAVPSGRSEAEFNAALMENANDNTAWIALQHADNDPLVASAQALAPVVTSAISYGKQNLPAPRTNLDSGTVWGEDLSVLEGYLHDAGNAGLETGVYAWVSGRVLSSRPASRVNLLGAYDAVFGCNALKRTDCHIDILGRTSEFYSASQPANGFDKEYIWQEQETWLQNCYFNDRNGCGQEVDRLIDASIAFHAVCSTLTAQMKQNILGQLNIKHLYANFYSIDCWVKNNGDASKDAQYCCYHQIPEPPW